MNRINCYSFYVLGKMLQRLEWMKGDSTYVDIVIATMRAQAMLHQLLNNDLKLKTSEEAAKSLFEGFAAMDELFEQVEQDKPKPASRLRINMVLDGIRKSIDKLESVMGVELVMAPIYSVRPRGVFSTDSLLDSADDVFEDVKSEIPDDAIADTRQAGRCLAFNLPTAAGFHIARATESVMRKTMDVFGCTPPKDSQRNWGQFTKSLGEHGLNKTLIHHLDQLRELHRNPLIHPEVTLTQLEAQQLWSLCTSAMVSMIAEIKAQVAAPSP